jgi:hypothetical protein
MAYARLPIAVPWFRRESFEQTKAIEGCDLRGEFDDWELRARRLFEILRTTGQPLVRVFLEPKELSEFAQNTGAFAITAAVRADLANDKLARCEELPLPETVVECSFCRQTYPISGGVLIVGFEIEVACDCGAIVRQSPPRDLRAG